MSQTTIKASNEEVQGQFDRDRFIPYLLTHINYGLSKGFETALRPLRMTNKQWRVLAALWAKDGQAISQLCVHTAIDHSTLSRVVDRLVGDGKVERGTSPDDARSTLINLTDQGHETFQALLPIAIAQADWAVSGIDQAELDQLIETLHKLLANIRVSPYPRSHI